ncbi:MAG: Flp pilus assembly protein CpaB [Acidimicrobiales bacterium]
MRPKPRRRRVHPVLALRRQPRLWWLLTVAVALAVGWLVSTIVAEAERARLAWGTTELVAVASRHLSPGTAIDGDDVELVERPRALVPTGALSDIPDGQVAAAAIEAGEVVVAARLAPMGLGVLAATLPEGTRAVAVPVEAGLAPPLLVGDRVDVMVALAPEAAGGDPPGFVVAADALVVAVDEAAVTVAVSRAAAPRIAVALGLGAVTLALIGP